MKVLVFVEQRDNKIKSSAFEALTVASKLAGAPENVAAVIVGSGVSGLCGQLAGWGADTIYSVESGDLANFNAMTYTAAVESAVKGFGAQVVLGVASPMGRDLFPRLAARMDGGILTDLVQIEASGSEITGVKPMYSGKVLADVSTAGAAVNFVTIRQNVIPANKSNTGAAKAVTLPAPTPDARLKTIEIKKGKSSKPDLTEAVMIISGGRAMGNADNFKILHECADVIGATVGASRAAVDSGYATHDMQVGQTGKMVNPTLYIACGISGSIQHMAGMRTSKTIVAINTDKDAPIFGVASYGIVADLFQAVPILTQKLKELLK
ncbi:MAG: electron transfer flavoprotein subunit alpha/FixB family protein [Proteobacteria bacterium]|nr:electron transfer flavoprotein subunit alpha/FixB family protein [Pseudomonadota bacterium]